MKSKLKILFITAYPVPNKQIGGVSTVAKYLTESLDKSDKVDQIHIISFSSDEEIIQQSILNLKKSKVSYLRGQKKLTLLFNSYPDFFKIKNFVKNINFRPDIIHGQGVSSDGLQAVRLGKLLNIPSIVTIHGMVDIEAKIYKKDWYRTKLIERRMNYILSNANGLIFTAPYRFEELTKRSNGYNFIIENPIMDDYFNISSKSLFSKNQNIVFLGLIQPRKRILDIIRAFKLVSQNFEKSLLNIIGPVVNIDYMSQIKNMIYNFQLEDKVNILGIVSNERLLDELGSAKLFVMASEEETTPQAIAEAMAAGIPIIATNVGGIPSMIKDGVNGFLFDVGDVNKCAEKMILLLTDEELWLKFSNAAKIEAEKYRGYKIAERTISAYESIINNYKK